MAYLELVDQLNTLCFESSCAAHTKLSPPTNLAPFYTFTCTVNITISTVREAIIFSSLAHVRVLCFAQCPSSRRPSTLARPRRLRTSGRHACTQVLGYRPWPEPSYPLNIANCRPRLVPIGTDAHYSLLAAPRQASRRV